jgi:hypothetical protein
VEDGRTIPRSKFSADPRGAGGPTLAQLRTAAKEHLAAHPEINTTVPQQLMDDKHYEMLYTPPYVSQLQPIELIWAFTKHLVARQSHRSRSVHTAAVQTREAMDQVTKELCCREIGHTHKWMQQFMQSEEGGSLQRFIDLPALMHARPDWLQADDLAAPAPPPAEEDEDDKENMQWTR